MKLSDPNGVRKMFEIEAMESLISSQESEAMRNRIREEEEEEDKNESEEENSEESQLFYELPQLKPIDWDNVIISLKPKLSKKNIEKMSSEYTISNLFNMFKKK